MPWLALLIGCLKRAQGVAKIIRNRCFEILPLFCARMVKAKSPCVQHLPGEVYRHLRRIHFVTQDGMAEMMKVHPNLMCPAAVQSTFDQAKILVGANDAILCFRGATTL